MGSMPVDSDRHQERDHDDPAADSKSPGHEAGGQADEPQFPGL